MEGSIWVVVLRLEATKEGDLCDCFTVSLQCPKDGCRQVGRTLQTLSSPGGGVTVLL